MNETKFNGMGSIYAKYRPPYPQEFINYLYSEVGIRKNSIIADIGSGTGILTKLLLKKGNKVFSVEPNDDMRIIAESDLIGYDNFVSVNATAESTTLDTHSIDFITVAQAFHWFDREKFKTECRRVLKPSGKVILVWNSRVFEAESVKEGDSINRKFCPNFKGFSGGMRGAESEDDFNDFFADKCEKKVFQNDQPCDLDGFIGRNLSASYALKANDENYHSYIAEMTASFNKHAIDGKLIMPVVTKSYIGTV
ncbi:MAG: class I SAM-dependent methyltransferase [Oscillospiraceae bacterium]|nr:class I SAM-dependent methyltransferase [Oscillospiraceae bacterium]